MSAGFTIDADIFRPDAGGVPPRIAVAIAATFPAGVAQRVNLDIDVLTPWFGARATRWLKCGGAVAPLLFYFFLAWQVAVPAS